MKIEYFFFFVMKDWEKEWKNQKIQERAVKCRLLGIGCPCVHQLSPAVAAAACMGLHRNESVNGEMERHWVPKQRQKAQENKANVPSTVEASV